MNNILDNIINRPRNIKTFFIASFVLLSIISSIVIFIIGYNNANNYINQQIIKEAHHEIKKRTNSFKQKLEINRKTIISLSNNFILDQYINEPSEKNEKYLINLFKSIIESQSNIMQLRFIDKTGLEKIRLERNKLKEEVFKVEKQHLQNKSGRYYFKETAKLKNKQIWISDIDLNMEKGKIQIPHNPTIRFATPIYANNQFKGIVIINLFMEDILAQLKISNLFDIFIIDEDGFYLIGEIKQNNKLIDLSWSKQLKKDISIKDIEKTDANKILNSLEYNHHNLFSRYISSDLFLEQKLTLILKIKKEKLEELISSTESSFKNTILIALTVSILLGLLLSYVPSKLAQRLIRRTNQLKESKQIFDEYNKAMGINNIISKSDLRGRITYVNDNFCKVSGYSKEEVIGKPHSLLRSPDSPKETFKELWQTIESKKIWKGILKNRKKNGEYYHVDIAIMPILDLSGEIIEYIAIRHNITDLIKQKQQLIDVTTKDALTSFYNRSKLLLDIQNSYKNNLAVIDIDHFSSINDFYGHNIGDIVIKQFGKLISESLTNEFILYRLHADKYAILNTTLSKEKFSNFIQLLNQKMIDTVIDLDVLKYDIITTSGVSFEANCEIILTAEIANKHAKKIHKHFLIYDKNLQIEKKFEDNLTWIQKIKSALSEDRIVVHYQPIYNNITKQIEKYEALVRIEEADGKLISPFFFLDTAKKSKQYINITKRVIDNSFEMFKNNKYEFSINLTLEDILDNELNEYLLEKLDQYKLGDRLVLELVESEGIDDYSILEKRINKFKSYGCKLAIDDFGTGYSNFEYLIKIKADFVKIDGSMIKDINTNENSKEIVKTIVEFCKKMELKTIAEYVSTKETLEVIEELNIDYSQGFYVGKPQANLQTKPFTEE